MRHFPAIMMLVEQVAEERRNKARNCCFYVFSGEPLSPIPNQQNPKVTLNPQLLKFEKVEGRAMAHLLCAADIRMVLFGAWMYERVVTGGDFDVLVLPCHNSCLRTLAALADAHDEHMLIVRLADKEDVDGVMFQEELFR